MRKHHCFIRTSDVLNAIKIRLKLTDEGGENGITESIFASLKRLKSRVFEPNQKNKFLSLRKRGKSKRRNRNKRVKMIEKPVFSFADDCGKLH